LRTGALDSLRAMPAAAGSVLPELLADPDADSGFSLRPGARSANRRSKRLLCDVLRTDTEVNVCAAAVDVLSKLVMRTRCHSCEAARSDFAR